MELGKQEYATVMSMPVNRLRKYLNWKINYDREMLKTRSDKLDSIRL